MRRVAFGQSPTWGSQFCCRFVKDTQIGPTYLRVTHESIPYKRPVRVGKCNKFEPLNVVHQHAYEATPDNSQLLFKSDLRKP